MTDPHADAELRLGRPLTLAERNIDIVGLDRVLAAGKQRLHKAVDREKRRAVNAHFRYRRPIRLDVTDNMRQVLRGLYMKGQQHGREELRKLTGTNMALSQDDKVKLSAIERKLNRLLHDYGQKVTGKVAEAETAASIGETAEIVIVRQTLMIPGALDVASQMVSGTLFTGIGSVFEQATGLFTGFVRSAVLDNATCDPCAEGDGDEYDTWDEAMLDLPDGGPALDCDGEGRCRCRLVPKV